MSSCKLRASVGENVNKLFRLETKLFFTKGRFREARNFPIIINNFNRLEYLEQQVDWLLSCGHKNLHIIDNASTYEPLLRFYKKVSATVYFLDRNVGHEAFWRSHLWQRFGKYFHVLTDPDVLPSEATPTDFMEYFYSVLQRYPEIKKVGFGLKIDDLPDHYPKKSEVINWEKRFFEHPVAPGLWHGKIDTTFALYRPGAFLQCWDDTLRTDHPYTLRHMPWYENPATFNAETQYYLQHTSSASSWYKTLTGEDERYA